VWYDAQIKNDISSHLPGAAGTVPCGIPVSGSVWPPITIVPGANSNSCDPNYSFWQVGSRTQWNITKDFYMGVDVTYTHLNTAYQGANNNGSNVYPAVSTKPALPFVDDQSVVSGIFRAQMNFEARNEGTSFVFGQR